MIIRLIAVCGSFGMTRTIDVRKNKAYHRNDMEQCILKLLS